CESNGITPFMFFYTAFSVLLCRLSGSNDIVIGTPLSGRTHKSLEGMIGLFVNTLALRTCIEGGMDFLHLLDANKHLILDSFSHQDLPFDILVDEVCAERAVNHAPVFQIMFAMQNNEPGKLNLNDEDTHQTNYFRSESPDTAFVEITTRFDLELHVEGENGDFAFSWIFNTQLFEEDTIVGFSRCFFTLLESVLRYIKSDNAIHQNLSSLQILDEADPYASVNEWNESVSQLLSGYSYFEQTITELITSTDHRSPLKVVVLSQTLQIQPKGVVGNIGLWQSNPDKVRDDIGSDAKDYVNAGDLYPTPLLGRMSHTGELLLAQHDSYTRVFANNNQSRALQALVCKRENIAFCHIDIGDSAPINHEIVCYLCLANGVIDDGIQNQIRRELIGLI
ncbi:MAG: condensation domain-containing protein, partial [Pseudomonadota bacterium]